MMSAEQPVVVHSFRVGKRTCTVTVAPPERGQAVSMTVDWTPTVPRRLTKREMRQYREGRDRVIAELAEQTGMRTAVFEV